MTKEELIDMYMQDSAAAVEKALVIGRRIAGQHFNLVGNDLVVCKVAEMILDNVPFAISMDEPNEPEAAEPETSGTASGATSGPTTATITAVATNAKESTTGTAGKAS